MLECTIQKLHRICLPSLSILRVGRRLELSPCDDPSGLLVWGTSFHIKLNRHWAKKVGRSVIWSWFNLSMPIHVSFQFNSIGCYKVASFQFIRFRQNYSTYYKSLLKLMMQCHRTDRPCRKQASNVCVFRWKPTFEHSCPSGRQPHSHLA